MAQQTIGSTDTLPQGRTKINENTTDLYGAAGVFAQPSSPNAANIEGIAGELPSGWAWRNQGGASYTFADGALVLTAPASSGDNIRGIECAVSAGAFKWRACVAHVGTKFNYAASGLYLIDSVSGRLVYCGTAVDTTNYVTGVTKYTNVTTYSAGAASDSTNGGSTLLGQSWRWYEIERDGSNNLFFRYSPTGVEGSFIQLHTESHTTFLTNGPSHFGIFANANNASNGIKALFRCVRKLV